MAKNEYIGVNNVARKVSQPYIGVNNVARKVKSGFIGVNGVARQYYESVVYNTWKRYSLTDVQFNACKIYLATGASSSSTQYQYNYYYLAQSRELMVAVPNNNNAPILYEHTGVANNYPPSASYPYLSVTGLTITTSDTIYGDIKNAKVTADSSYMRQGELATSNISSKYVRVTDRTNYGDKGYKLTNYAIYPYTDTVRNYVFIPGWQYSNTICYYNGSTWLNYYCLITPNPNSYLFMIHHFISDDDEKQWWTRILQADNCAEDVVAPAGTYPDNGISGGYIYIKQ